MTRHRQLLLSSEMKLATEHGGELSFGKRKGRRPFSAKRPVHLVLRAENARGRSSLLRYTRFIKECLALASSRWAVRTYELSINSNHLHMVVRAKDRRGFQNFLRAFSGRVALRITGAKKGNALATRFWSLPAFTRLLEWGKEFRGVGAYIVQNQLEAWGVIPYTPRKKKGPRAKAPP